MELSWLCFPSPQAFLSLARPLWPGRCSTGCGGGAAAAAAAAAAASASASAEASASPLHGQRRAGGPAWLEPCVPDLSSTRRPLRIAVLLSGGVDSSVALQRLVAAGHSCVAYYLQIWFQEDFRNFWDACPWEEDLRFAQETCAALRVELQTIPLTSQYWDRVGLGV